MHSNFLLFDIIVFKLEFIYTSTRALEFSFRCVRHALILICPSKVATLCGLPFPFGATTLFRRHSVPAAILLIQLIPLPHMCCERFSAAKEELIVLGYSGTRIQDLFTLCLLWRDRTTCVSTFSACVFCLDCQPNAPSERHLRLQRVEVPDEFRPSWQYLHLTGRPG